MPRTIVSRRFRRLLDGLNGGSGGDALVRDARWLIQTAQGPLTRRLEPYFSIAERIAASFTDPRRLDIHRAGALLTSGHLRSQLRHRASETGRPADNPEVLATTRNSNSMDAALLVRDLVPLLDAYGTACAADDPEQRRHLADAILQGVSADPELFLTRLDLLAPCTMIEDLFIQRGEDGRAAIHADGRGASPRPRALLASSSRVTRSRCRRTRSGWTLDTASIRRSASRMGSAPTSCRTWRSIRCWPSRRSASVSRTCSRSGGSLEHKRARVEGWKARQETRGAADPLDYSAAWAAQMFDRTTSALRARARHKDRANASAVPSARLFVESAPEGTVAAQEHCVTSDLQRALATGATAFPKGQIVRDRNEGRFLASANEDGKWFGISKVILTLCTSQGHDALLTGVPPSVVDTLRLTCPGLVVMA